MHEPGIVEPKQSTGGQCAGKRTDHACRMKAVGVQSPARCARNAGARFNPGNVGGQHVGTTRAALRRHR
jgi:hypothetical protein